MSGSAGFTLAVVLGVLASMMLGLSTPDLILLAAMFLLLVSGILTPDAAFQGFSNAGMLTIAALFVVAAGLRETGAVASLSGWWLGRARTTRRAVARLTLPVAAASGFLNNTTVVTALLPAVHDWGRRTGIPVSRLLLPLSYAAILGGTCTLIGTSTNLVVSGLVLRELPRRTDLHALGVFDIAFVGIPVAVAGVVALVVLAPWLLPDRSPPLPLADDPREYAMELTVPRSSRMAGKTVDEAGLWGIPGAYLVAIGRGDTVHREITPDLALRAGDHLRFVGAVDAMVDLQRLPGLRVSTDQIHKLTGARGDRNLVEAVVSERNLLRGQAIRDGRFRNVYNAVVIAVARHGERVAEPIPDIVLMPGDVLLLEAPPDFVQQQRTRTDFYLVGAVEGARPPRFERAPVAVAILVGMVVAAATGLLETVTAAWVAAAAMLLTRCLSAAVARRAIDMPVLVAIAAAFALGNAMQVTGLDRSIAEVAFASGARNPIAALLVVYLATALLTELITNNAAAVLAFPFALSLADRLEASPMPFVIAVMMAASASFLTPIGYQTNLMVYSPGGYRSSDYLRLGIPLSAVAAAVTVLIIPIFWPL